MLPLRCAATKAGPTGNHAIPVVELNQRTVHATPHNHPARPPQAINTIAEPGNLPRRRPHGAPPPGPPIREIFRAHRTSVLIRCCIRPITQIWNLPGEFPDRPSPQSDKAARKRVPAHHLPTFPSSIAPKATVETPFTDPLCRQCSTPHFLARGPSTVS